MLYKVKTHFSHFNLEMINFSEDDKKRYWIVIVRGMLNICNNYYKPHNRDLEIEVNGKKILLDHKYIISYEFYEFISFLTKDECLKETVILTIREIVTNIKNSLLNISNTFLVPRNISLLFLYPFIYRRYEFNIFAGRASSDNSWSQNEFHNRM